MPTDITTLPYKDYKWELRYLMMRKWQSDWSQQEQNKLHLIKHILKKWERAWHRERFYEVVLCRLRIGHTYLTHGHLLCGEHAPVCNDCGELLTLLHILTTCRNYEPHRHQLFAVIFKQRNPMHPSFLIADKPLVPFDTAFTFLKRVCLLHQL